MSTNTAPLPALDRPAQPGSLMLAALTSGTVAAGAVVALAAIFRAGGVHLDAGGQIPLPGFATVTLFAAFLGGLLAMAYRGSSTPRHRFVRTDRRARGIVVRRAAVGCPGRRRKVGPDVDAPDGRGDHHSAAGPSAAGLTATQTNIDKENEMAQYLLSVWHDDEYVMDFTSPDAQRTVAQVGAFNEELQRTGAWVFAGGLRPASSATTLRYADGSVSMTDGPYAETKEQMGGFWVVEAADLDAALALAQKASAACEGPVEIRPMEGG